MTSSISSSFFCSPAMSLPTGMPVQAEMTSAISVGPTFSAIIGGRASGPSGRSTPSGPTTVFLPTASAASASRICFSRAGISP